MTQNSIDRKLRKMIIGGALRDPFSRGFDISQWEQITEGKASSVVSAAIVVRRYLDHILLAMENHGYTAEHPWRILQALLLYLNNVGFDLSLAIQKQIAAGDLMLERLPRFENDVGDNYGTDDVHSIYVDAIALPLGDVLAKLDDASTDVADVADVDEELWKHTQELINIALAWNSVKYAWRLVLYQGYDMHEEDGVFSFSGDEDESYFVVGRYREMHVTLTNFALEIRDSKRKSKNLITTLKSSRSGRNLRIERKIDWKPNYATLMVDEFTRMHVLPTTIGGTGISVQELFDAWEFLACVSSDTLDRLGTSTASRWDQLGLYSLESLVEGLAKCLHVDAKKANNLIDALSQRGSTGFDPWSCPIIRVGDNLCMLILGVLATANRRYVLECLLKKFDYAFDERGPAFENYLWQKLTNAKKESRFGAIVTISAPSFFVVDDGKREEIDLLLVVGRNAYVIEAKCSLFPTDVSRNFNLANQLREADIQLTRKVEFIKRHLHDLPALHPSLENIGCRPVNVSGLIVTNFLGGASSHVSNTITDALSLCNYISSGATMLYLRESSNPELPPDMVTLRCYDSFETFRSNFPLWLKFSPSVRLLESFIVRKPTRFFYSGLGLDDFLVTMPDVVLPADNEVLRDHCCTVRDQFYRYCANHLT